MCVREIYFSFVGKCMKLKDADIGYSTLWTRRLTLIEGAHVHRTYLLFLHSEVHLLYDLRVIQGGTGLHHHHSFYRTRENEILSGIYLVSTAMSCIWHQVYYFVSSIWLKTAYKNKILWHHRQNSNLNNRNLSECRPFRPGSHWTGGSGSSPCRVWWTSDAWWGRQTLGRTSRREHNGMDARLEMEYRAHRRK